MIKKHLIFLTVTFTTLVFMSGCISSTSKYYILNATAKENKNQNANYSIAIDQVSIPEEVDRPQIIIKAGSNQISLCEFNRWAEPLGSNIARVIARNLAVLIGTNQVIAAQMANFNPAYRVTVDIQSFDSDLGKSINIVAVWVINQSSGVPAISGCTVAVENVNDNSFNALAAAHSKALLKVSQDIANAIQSENGNSKKK